MAFSTIVSPRRWYFDLSGRDRDFRLFQIPSGVVDTCGVTWNTRRDLRVVLSTGRRMSGFCTITSGTELSIPTHLQDDFRQADWFVAESSARPPASR
jgi:hypothetical protein